MRLCFSVPYSGKASPRCWARDPAPWRSCDLFGFTSGDRSPVSLHGSLKGTKPRRPRSRPGRTRAPRRPRRHGGSRRGSSACHSSAGSHRSARPETNGGASGEAGDHGPRWPSAPGSDRVRARRRHALLRGRPQAEALVKLRRIENARARPDVTVLIDHYEENWGCLWWIRLRGRARVRTRLRMTAAAS